VLTCGGDEHHDRGHDGGEGDDDRAWLVGEPAPGDPQQTPGHRHGDRPSAPQPPREQPRRAEL